MSSAIQRTAHVCPVCGYQSLDQAPYANFPPLPLPEHLVPPYSQYFGDPSYQVCDCCGFEFGNDDEPGTAAPSSFREYRDEWLSGGAQWFNPAKRPADWTSERQLRNASITRA